MDLRPGCQVWISDLFNVRLSKRAIFISQTLEGQYLFGFNAWICSADDIREANDVLKKRAVYTSDVASGVEEEDHGRRLRYARP